jgi:hypothetical protein
MSQAKANRGGSVAKAAATLLPVRQLKFNQQAK